MTVQSWQKRPVYIHKDCRGQWCNFCDSDFQVQSVQLLIRERERCALSSHFFFLFPPERNPGSKHSSVVTFIGLSLLIVKYFASYILVSLTILFPLYGSAIYASFTNGSISFLFGCMLSFQVQQGSYPEQSCLVPENLIFSCFSTSIRKSGCLCLSARVSPSVKCESSLLKNTSPSTGESTLWRLDNNNNTLE